MRRLASRRMRASCTSAGSPESRSPSKPSVAMADATSPALAPPMPSATAKKGGASTKSSSLALRWRPTSVLPACSTIRSGDHSWYRYSVSPMRIVSATLRRSAVRTWRPFR